MKVAFNARALSAASPRGGGRYTLELLRELAAMDVRLLLYSDQPVDENRLSGLAGVAAEVHVAPPMSYLAWEQRWFPARCREHEADLIHCPINYGLPSTGGLPKVLTLHDAVDPAYYGWGRGHGALGRLHPSTIAARLRHRVARNAADRIIAPSEHARREFISVLRVPPEKITVIPHAAGRRFHEPVTDLARETMRRAHGLALPYVLNVGGWDPRKNVPFLIEAFAAANVDGTELALAGGGSKRDEKVVIDTIARLKLGNRVRLLGPVDDEELPALYAEALCYAHPSLYEGFGLQLCEAMAMGCPVLAAAATSAPEVLDGGGALFGTETAAELARLLASVATDAKLRAELAENARRRAGAHSWRKTAEATLAVYRELLPAPE